MDPVEVREERVAAAGAPVAGTATTQPVAATSRVGVYPLAYRANQIVWFIVGVLNVILALDFVLRLLAANDTGFAHLIYSLGRVLAAPFDGIFGNNVVDGQYYLRWSDLLGIVVYSLIGWGITKLIKISMAPRDRSMA